MKAFLQQANKEENTQYLNGNSTGNEEETVRKISDDVWLVVVLIRFKSIFSTSAPLLHSQLRNKTAICLNVKHYKIAMDKLNGILKGKGWNC